MQQYKFQLDRISKRGPGCELILFPGAIACTSVLRYSLESGDEVVDRAVNTLPTFPRFLSTSSVVQRIIINHANNTMRTLQFRESDTLTVLTNHLEELLCVIYVSPFSIKSESV